MAAQSCTCSTDANAAKELNFLGTESVRLILTFDDLNKFSANSDSDKKKL